MKTISPITECPYENCPFEGTQEEVDDHLAYVTSVLDTPEHDWTLEDPE
jgi:hypothetical protein